MHVLIDLLHPAHVHVFRAISAELLARGHSVAFAARDKDVTLELLKAYGLEAQVISRQQPGLRRLVWEMLSRTARLARIARLERPDVLLGIMGPSIAVVGRFMRIPSVVMYDTEIASITNRWVYPLATHVLTPKSYEGQVVGSHIRYPSYHELAYLHPNRFTPNPAVLESFGVSSSDRFTVMRFVSWKASHDLSDAGISDDDRLRLVYSLRARGRVLISSEEPLPPELREFSLTGPVHLVHHLLAFADLFVGESATMASEAAVLGTPAIYMANRSRGYLNDLARFGLVSVLAANDVQSALRLIEDGWPDEVVAQNHHRELLGTRVDTTNWVVDWLEREFSR